jgi:hypothetical protein
MTCENCDCQKKKPVTRSAVVHEPRRYVRLNFDHLRDFVTAALVAAAVYIIVSPPCDCKALTARIEQLEKHSVKVDSQFHKSLK